MITKKIPILIVFIGAILILFLLGIKLNRYAFVKASSPGENLDNRSLTLQDLNNFYIPFLTKSQISAAPTATSTSTPTATATSTATPTNTPTSTNTPTPTSGPPSSAIIIDHNNRDITLIPLEWIQTAKDNVIWSYGSTSHGTQLWNGTEHLSLYIVPPTYNFLKGWIVPPNQGSPEYLRMGYNDQFSWDSATFYTTVRNMLDSAPQANAFMWSWCAEMSWFSAGEVQQYLNLMTQLEGEYPGVKFVYMTGHTDDTADQQVLIRNNNLIREYVLTNNKILYDFADIESWLPDGTLYPGIPDDSCPWCQSWCDTHQGYCPVPEITCAHSHSLNCYLKGQAFWWLSARLAGWAGQ